MNANEARILSEKNLSGPVIKPYLDIIYGKIQVAAQVGRRSIVRPFQGIRIPHPTWDQEKSIWQYLSGKDGYTVKHHNDPDPGDPRSSGYTEISW